jgi:hypothetical protein
MDKTAIPASPAKLHNGDWGCRTRSDVQVGDIVAITTRAGKSWDARIEQIVWKNDEIALCATASLDRQSGCSRCRRTATRTAQIWEDCEYCGTEPIYM